MLNDLSISAAKPPQDELHAWAGDLTPDSLKTWVDHHLHAHRTAIDQLLTVQGPRTVDNTLVPYDRAVAALGIAGRKLDCCTRFARKKRFAPRRKPWCKRFQRRRCSFR